MNPVQWCSCWVSDGANSWKELIFHHWSSWKKKHLSLPSVRIIHFKCAQIALVKVKELQTSTWWQCVAWVKQDNACCEFMSDSSLWLRLQWLFLLRSQLLSVFAATWLSHAVLICGVSLLPSLHVASVSFNNVGSNAFPTSALHDLFSCLHVFPTYTKFATEKHCRISHWRYKSGTFEKNAELLVLWQIPHRHEKCYLR